MPVLKNCELCGKEFEPRPCKPGRFCSVDCRKKYKIPRPEIFCLICKKSIHYYPSTIRKFCSANCKYEAQKSENNGPLAIWHKITYEESLDRLKKIFENKVIKTDNCWLWNGYLDKDGYGRLMWGEKKIGAHQASWIIHNGQILKGLFVLHHCDFRQCSSPKHLFLGTAADNNNDMMKKGRNKHLVGLEHWATKLSETEIIEIKKLLQKKVSQYKIAKQFNVSQQTISRINTGESFGDIK